MYLVHIEPNYWNGEILYTSLIPGNLLFRHLSMLYYLIVIQVPLTFEQAVQETNNSI